MSKQLRSLKHCQAPGSPAVFPNSFPTTEGVNRNSFQVESVSRSNIPTGTGSEVRSAADIKGGGDASIFVLYRSLWHTEVCRAYTLL